MTSSLRVLAMRSLLCVCAGGLWTPTARAQEADRPSEGDLFGGATDEGTGAGERPQEAEMFGGGAESSPPARIPVEAQSRDDRVLGDPSAATQFSPDVAPPDPLTIGGLIYLRSQSSATEGQAARDFTFSTPAIVDAYFDARPNDRVRGFVLGRMLYDPSRVDGASAADFQRQTLDTGSVQGSPSLASIFQPATRGPRTVLDQLWLRFDLGHRVFVTAGKQHVRWGTGRFWTPSDFLHITLRNPLAVFDARVGTTMVKFHLPVEALGWNFYGYVVTESEGATPNVGAIAGAARAEFVLGTSELGLGALVKDGRKPRLQADLSTGIGDFDLYGEVALRYGSEIDRVRFDDTAVVPPAPERLPWQSESAYVLTSLQTAVDLVYPTYRKSGVKAQAVGGLTYALQYADRDVFTLGAEYFYNSLGYDDPRVYPGLVLPHSRALATPASFFYLGQHYAAVFAALPAPFDWDLHSFTLSTIGNLSDLSFISRFDYTYTLLTHLRLEAFVAVHYGETQGEFRFGTGSGFTVGGIPFALQPALADFGLALRVSI